jgi:DUF1680 family protein
MWTDLSNRYNLGHLIEAALAHNDLYKNDRLPEPILEYVDLVCSTFGPGSNQIPGYPGHPEIELALQIARPTPPEDPCNGTTTRGESPPRYAANLHITVHQ